MENTQTTLSQLSSTNQVKAYFTQVVNLYNSGQQFPINLDDVWPLAYPRKDHAVRAIQKDFIEGIDYEVLLKNGEQNGSGGHNKETYMLTISAMEWLIARKVRHVFEVYRNMFYFSIKKIGHRLVNFNSDEKELLRLVNRYYNKGDALKVAKTLSVSRRNVSDVKNGKYRNHQVMEELVRITSRNKRLGITHENSYSRQLRLQFFDDLEIARQGIEGGAL